MFRVERGMLTASKKEEQYLLPVKIFIKNEAPK
jgi:hypothetical protein